MIRGILSFALPFSGITPFKWLFYRKVDRPACRLSPSHGDLSRVKEQLKTDFAALPIPLADRQVRGGGGGTPPGSAAQVRPLPFRQSLWVKEDLVHRLPEP